VHPIDLNIHVHVYLSFVKLQESALIESLTDIDALFEAIYFGMIKAVTTLIELGARVDSPDKAGVTPLMAAIVSPYYEYPILKTLLERLLNARSSVNYVNKKTNDSAVLLAAQRITADSAADELKLLLRHGANIDMTDRRGQTALHKMAGKKHIFAARALLEHGARADIRDKQGKTALTIWPELSQTILSMSESQSSLQSSVPLSMDET
jgi:ankyrin repeat protein